MASDITAEGIDRAPRREGGEGIKIRLIALGAMVAAGSVALAASNEGVRHSFSTFITEASARVGSTSNGTAAAETTVERRIPAQTQIERHRATEAGGIGTPLQVAYDETGASVPPPPGFYFIRNRQTGGVMQCKDTEGCSPRSDLSPIS